MRIAVGLPTGVVAAPPHVILEWAARADAGPFSSVAVLDRVVSTGYEALTVLAVVASITRRVGLMTSIVVAPARETTLLARQAATIHALSGGRLTLGVAVGVREDDYLATGFPFHRRGRRIDEQLPLLRRLWAGERVSEEVGAIGPGWAGVGGRPQLLVGGYAPAVARRIARWGDGFMAPGGGTPHQIAALWRSIVDEWQAEGRDGLPRMVGATYFALGPDADEIARAYIDRMYGYDAEVAARRLAGIPRTPDAVGAIIRQQAELGADELILRPCGPGIDQLERAAELAG